MHITVAAGIQQLAEVAGASSGQCGAMCVVAAAGGANVRRPTRPDQGMFDGLVPARAGHGRGARRHRVTVLTRLARLTDPRAGDAVQGGTYHRLPWLLAATALSAAAITVSGWW